MQPIEHNRSSKLVKLNIHLRELIMYSSVFRATKSEGPSAKLRKLRKLSLP